MGSESLRDDNPYDEMIRYWTVFLKKAAQFDIKRGGNERSGVNKS